MSNSEHRLPLRAALAGVLTLAGVSENATASGISSAALSSTLSRLGQSAVAGALAFTDPVTSCADDGAPGTLRSVINGAVSGDTIDMTGLPGAIPNCASGTITLALGAISTDKSLVLAGPPNAELSIAAAPGGARNFSTTGAQLFINDLTIRGGRGLTFGGCIYSKGAVTLNHSTVTDCQVALGSPQITFAFGGGIYANSVTMTNSSVVSDNVAASVSNGKYGGGGGGVSAKTLFSCTDSSVSNNYANNVGGGIVSQSGLQITRCTIEGNTAAMKGGGILQATSSYVHTIEASTISGNTATSGGGVYTSALISFRNSTIAFNSAAGMNTAGILSATDLSLQSTIVAKNISAGSVTADVKVSGYLTGADNLIVSTDATPDAGVITVTSDPELLPLADNGGPTLTHALASSSPAIDAGNNSTGATTDQRGAGFLREVPLGNPDIGAFEFRGDGIFYDGFDGFD